MAQDNYHSLSGLHSSWWTQQPDYHPDNHCSLGTIPACPALTSMPCMCLVVFHYTCV